MMGSQSTLLGGQTTYPGPLSNSRITNQLHYTTTGIQQTVMDYKRSDLTNRTNQATNQAITSEQLPVESRIEYIPFEKKYIEYDQVERIERIPYEREIVEYEEITRTERVPYERTIIDYYAVETQIQYIPREIIQTIREVEEVEHVKERVQYLPVETQIVHFP